MIGILNLPTVTPLRSSPDNRIFVAGTSRSVRKTSVRAAATAFAEAPPTRNPAGSLYEVLRLDRNASATEIKAAYRSLAKLYHPDAAEDSDGRDFIEIHNAYATLSDPAARALYDMSLRARVGRPPFVHATEIRPGFCPTRRWETDQCW
ncbi:hypothetical protein NMG60_11002025 [Bertholletia excelsa]